MEALARLSPKQPSPKRSRDWYPYYAGFTERFAEAVLEEHLRTSRFVLDPWSGSGTSAVACIRHGKDAVGVDINPALTVIARARLNPRSSQAILADLSKQMIAIAQRTPACVGGSGTSDPGEVEHRIRGKWNTKSGKWNDGSGGSGTPGPGFVNARR